MGQSPIRVSCAAGAPAPMSGVVGEMRKRTGEARALIHRIDYAHAAAEFVHLGHDVHDVRTVP